MSQKQIVYREILKRGLPYLRKVFSLQGGNVEAKEALSAELEFIHNIPISILDPDFIEHDLWFLNHQAKTFFSSPLAKYSPNYNVYVALIRTLFDEVPSEYRNRLSWSGPLP
jgi:hypothetical protein